MKNLQLPILFLWVVIAPTAVLAVQRSLSLPPASAQRLRQRLNEMTALQYCRARLNAFGDSTASLAWAKAEVRTRFPLLVQQVGAASDKAILSAARKSCSYVFDQTIRLPGAKPPKPPKPIVVKIHRPASECSLDAFWVDQLRRNGSIYLQGRRQGVSGDAAGGCLIDFKGEFPR